MIIRKLIIIILQFILLSNVCYANNYSMPSADEIQKTLVIVYNQFKNLKTGKNADYIPELAKVNSNYFGIAVATVEGKIYAIGDANIPFAIESISKPFAYALALEDNGEILLTSKIGLNATGESFNSVEAIEEMPSHLQNPLVNAGAIQVTSFIKGKNSDEKWQHMQHFFNKLSGEKLKLSQAIYQSEATTNQHNKAIATLLDSYKLMNGDPLDAVDRYTKACSVLVTAKQLAFMGVILANGGVNPNTHEQIISKKYVRNVLSVMAINGLYENSGIWWWEAGIPAKSGVGGGILAVVPQKMAIVVYSPRLDEAGNSVRAQAVIKELSKQWKLHVLES